MLTRPSLSRLISERSSQVFMVPYQEIASISGNDFDMDLPLPDHPTVCFGNNFLPIAVDPAASPSRATQPHLARSNPYLHHPLQRLQVIDSRNTPINSDRESFVLTQPRICKFPTTAAVSFGGSGLGYTLADVLLSHSQLSFGNSSTSDFSDQISMASPAQTLDFPALCLDPTSLTVLSGATFCPHPPTGERSTRRRAVGAKEGRGGRARVRVRVMTRGV